MDFLCMLASCSAGLCYSADNILPVAACHSQIETVPESSGAYRVFAEPAALLRYCAARTSRVQAAHRVVNAQAFFSKPTLAGCCHHRLCALLNPHILTAIHAGYCRVQPTRMQPTFLGPQLQRPGVHDRAGSV
jgi:hypothetical protein